MNKKILYFCLLLFWMGVIFLFSNQQGSSSASTSYFFLDKLISLFKITPSDQLLNNLHLIIRKLAHMSEYAILTFLLYKNLQLNKVDNLIFPKTLLLCFLYASLDEFHQGFVAGRAASAVDVLIDLSGGILMVLGILLFKKVFLRQ